MNENLEQVQGDIRSMTNSGHSNKKLRKKIL